MYTSNNMWFALSVLNSCFSKSRIMWECQWMREKVDAYTQYFLLVINRNWSRLNFIKGKASKMPSANFIVLFFFYKNRIHSARFASWSDFLPHSIEQRHYIFTKKTIGTICMFYLIAESCYKMLGETEGGEQFKKEVGNTRQLKCSASLKSPCFWKKSTFVLILYKTDQELQLFIESLITN